MTIAWQVGLRTFGVALLLGLVLRGAVEWIAHQNLAHFFDLEGLGVLLMIAVFAGIGVGSRKR